MGLYEALRHSTQWLPLHMPDTQSRPHEDQALIITASTMPLENVSAYLEEIGLVED